VLPRPFLGGHRHDGGTKAVSNLQNANKIMRQEEEEDGNSAENTAELSPMDLMNMLSSLENDLEDKHRLRFGFF